MGVSEIHTSYNLRESAEKKESSCIPHDFINVVSDIHVGRVRFAVKMPKLSSKGSSLTCDHSKALGGPL